MASLSELAARTPASRDRYIDFLRVASLGGVIVGHFMMAVLVIGDDGSFSFTNILEVEPWTRWMTLVLQVMPIFFAVGGFSHAVALRSLRARGGGYADFVSERIGRLVRPALAFITVWAVVAIVVDLTTDGDAQAGAVLQIAGQLVWFIGIYLIAASLAPLMLRAHERWGMAALAALGLAVVAVDVARLAFDVPFVMWLNFAFVWLAVHQLGFFYADGAADRVGPRRLGGTMLVLGCVALAALVGLGPYGIAMVSFGGEELSNLTPPTVALLAFAVAQQGALLMVRDPLRRWLDRPRAWKGVIAAGSVAMTAYLWHFTALILVLAGQYLLGIGPEGGTGAWWLLKLVELVPFALLLVALIALFRRFERAPRRAGVVGPSAARAAVAAAGVVCAIVGMLGFAVVGFRGLATGYVGNLAGLPMPSWAPIVLVGASAMLTALAALPRGSVAVSDSPATVARDD
ncbi:acyltransferase family protein [Demequina sp.]|uniref:acyltransferase family protein n=1 Tax=Demequina sp. TaxID=2050685 RepID=UPI003A853E91